MHFGSMHIIWYKSLRLHTFETYELLECFSVKLSFCCYSQHVYFLFSAILQDCMQYIWLYVIFASG